MGGGDVVDLLIAQHRSIDAAFGHVAAAAAGQPRREAFAHLVELMYRHEHAEQDLVHPVLAAHHPDGADLAGARLAEEQALERAVAGLIFIDVTHRRFLSTLADLRTRVAVHATREETDEFPALRAALTGPDRRRLASQVRAAQIGQP
jgi:hypothetical protein